MKKKILIVVFIITIFVSGIFVDKLLFSNNNIDDGFNDLSKIEHKELLSMMLETDVASGEYSLESRSSWPTIEDGYVFNSTLSRCDKGSKLYWDDANNLVVMEGTTSDKCYVYFDKYQHIIINDSSVTVSVLDIVIAIDATAGDGEISKYYYSKDDGQSYIESTSNTYVFTNLEEGTYNIKYYVLDSNGKRSKEISKDIIVILKLSDCIKLQYTGTQGDNGLYYHTSGSGLNYSANDNSYRYSGANPNNYVCFGSSDDNCPEDNLYRILGVFDNKVKLIKADFATVALLGIDGDYYTTYASTGYGTSYYKGNLSTSDIGTYHWSSGGTWSTSNLNKVNLNTNFLQNIGSSWANKIAETTWIVGGNTDDNITDDYASKAYYYEIKKPATTDTYQAKIGLMYTSDYYYAAPSNYWGTSGYSEAGASYDYRKAREYNWMFLGLNDWTIVPCTSSYGKAFLVYNDGGYVSIRGVNESYPIAVRPTFYLKEDIIRIGGDGSKDNPYKIE